MVMKRIMLIMFELMKLYRHVLAGMHYTMYVLLAGVLHFWQATSKFLYYSVLEGYRKLQVLETILNASVRRRIFPAVLVLGPGMQIVSMFAYIKYHDVMKGSQLVFFLLLALDPTILNVMYCTGAGMVYGKSCKYLMGMKGKVKGKAEMKLLKSYAPLKVRFGGNFMDQLTPLVIQEFCSVQTANLLLLF